MTDTTGLYLIFKADAPAWVEECEGCSTPELKRLNAIMRQECPACHGTGSRTYRLAGMVKCKPVEDGNPGEMEILGFDESFDINSVDWMIKIITARAGTLPVSLMYHERDNPGGLRKIEVKK